MHGSLIITRKLLFTVTASTSVHTLLLPSIDEAMNLKFENSFLQPDQCNLVDVNIATYKI